MLLRNTNVLLQYYSVLQSTTLYYKVLLRPKRRQNDVHPVLLRTTKYYSSTASYYKVLLRTTNVLLQYYSSTTPYYKVLLQYYSLLQSTTLYYKVLLRPERRQNDVHPVLLRTTKYYSSTTSYYKVLLQYYSVLQNTTPVLQSTTLYYKVLLQYYSVLQTYYSSTTPYYKVLLQYYSLLQSTTLYYKVLLRPKRRQNDVHPVLLRTTKCYSSTTSYYKVLACTTKYYSSTTPYYKRTTKYYSNTTPYYDVLLQYYSVLQPYYSVLQSTTPTETTSERRPSSTTPYYKVLLQYCFVLQSTTPYYKVLLQYCSLLQSTTLYYKVLLRPKRRQNDIHPVLLPTTKYYSSTTSYYKVLLQYYSVLQTYYSSTTPYHSSTTNVLQSTTPYYSSTTPYYKVIQKLPKRAFRARLPQLFKEQASKTSISCETSSTFQRTSFQNEHFVRDFRNFSSDKLPKRAFRARLPQLFKEQASKTSISCEASSTFQGTSFQNEHFVRGFLNFSIKELPKSCACHAKRENDLSPWEIEASKRAFRARLPSNSTLSTWKSTISCEFFLWSHFYRAQKVWLLRSFRHFSRHSRIAAPATIFERVSRSRVPANAIYGNSTFATSQNAALATTSRKATSQSAAPATKKRRTSIESLPKYCACHAKHENDLPFCDLGPPKRAFRARLPPLFILWK